LQHNQKLAKTFSRALEMPPNKTNWNFWRNKQEFATVDNFEIHSRLQLKLAFTTTY